MNDYSNSHNSSNSHMHSEAHSIHHRQPANVNNTMLMGYGNGHNIGDTLPPRFDNSDFPALGDHATNDSSNTQSSHGHSHSHHLLHHQHHLHRNRRPYLADNFPIHREDFPALSTSTERINMNQRSRSRMLPNNKLGHSKRSGSSPSSLSTGPSSASSPSLLSSSSSRQAPPPPPPPPSTLPASSMSSLRRTEALNIVDRHHPSLSLSAMLGRPLNRSSVPASSPSSGPMSPLSSSSQPASLAASTVPSTTPSTTPSKTHSLPNSNGLSKWGLKGLLNVIRMTDPDLNVLALGTDLTTLGLNLNSSDVLYATFAYPCHDLPALHEPDYVLPYCYYMKPPALKTSHLSKFQLETLFYIFYNMPKDTLQVYAAKELHNRDWRYHKEMELWFTQTKKPDQSGEKEQCIFFDINLWEKRVFNERNYPNKLKFMTEDDLAML